MEKGKGVRAQETREKDPDGELGLGNCGRNPSVAAAAASTATPRARRPGSLTQQKAKGGSGNMRLVDLGEFLFFRRFEGR